MASIVRKYVVIESDQVSLGSGADTIGKLMDAAIGQALLEGRIIHSLAFEIESDEWHAWVREQHQVNRANEVSPSKRTR